MKKNVSRTVLGCACAAMLTVALAGCSTAGAASNQNTTAGKQAPTNMTASTTTTNATSSIQSVDTADLFSNRDLEQTADTSSAVTYTLSNGQDIEITQAGVYVISGTASDATITVNAADDAKVQIVLNGVSITNTDSPAIYVKSADKVFVTTSDGSNNTLTVTGTFTADGDTNTDAVIFSKDDLTLNGQGTLTISSTANGVTGKDDLTITGGTYNVTSTEDSFEANDSLAIAGGTFTVQSSKDAFHCENADDDTVGYIYIADGTFNITATDDGIQATTIAQIDGGTLNITSSEGIEGTNVLVNGGTITINASDDGINAAAKSTAMSVYAEFNGGDITITMGSGDTDAVDVNGSLTINGGTMNITATSAFDYDTSGQLNGGTVIVNGSQITELTTQMMGGPGGMQGGGMQGGGMQGGTQQPNGTQPNGTMQNKGTRS